MRGRRGNENPLNLSAGNSIESTKQDPEPEEEERERGSVLMPGVIRGVGQGFIEGSVKKMCITGALEASAEGNRVDFYFTHHAAGRRATRKTSSWQLKSEKRYSGSSVVG